MFQLTHARLVEVFMSAGNIAVFHHVEFQTAVGAVEADAVAFPRRVGVKTIVHGDFVLVTDHHIHVVLNGDAVAEHALVPVVAVLMFRIVVQPLKDLIRVPDLDGKGIFFRQFAAAGAGIKFRDAPFFRIFLAVKFQITHGKDRFRHGVQPPVHQVKVVRGLVDQQTAGIVLAAVPAAEVVRSMTGVQQPLKRDTGNRARNARFQHFLDLRVAGRITIVECDRDVLAGALLRVDDLLAFFRIHCHRLFRDDIAPHFHGFADVKMVRAVHTRHNNFVRLLLRDHLFKVRRLIHRRTGHVVLRFNAVRPELHPRAVGITDRQQLAVFLEPVAQCIDIHAATTARADQNIFQFFHKSLLSG